MWLRAFGVQLLHGGDGAFQCLPLGGVSDILVIKSQEGILASLDSFSDVAHQGIEGLGPVHQAYRKDQFRVLLVLHLNRDVVLRKHVPSTEPKLEGVSQVNGNCDTVRKAVFNRSLNGGLGGKDPGGAGEVNCYRVNVNARDREA